MIAATRSERVVARLSFDAPRGLRLREPTGHDELALDGIDTRAAVSLLERLVEPSGSVVALAASDRDALLAALHRGLWGDRIVATRTCEACGQLYDLSFALSELQRQLEAGRETVGVVGNRELRGDDGLHLRLPDAGEEEEAALLGPAAGALRLAGIMGAVVEDERLEAVAPILDVDLDAACTECGHRSLARFDIQTFALQRLLDEREGTLAEVHALASNYGWALGEILALTRGLRRSFAERVEGGLS